MIQKIKDHKKAQDKVNKKKRDEILKNLKNKKLVK